MRDFNPRSPHRERLCHSREPGRDAKISIHAPLTGSDADLFMYFRRSLISIHAPLTGSDMFYVFCFQFQPISIHAPLTGSDHDLTIPINSVSTISIHAPLTGSDFRGSVTPTHTRHFNPRSPHRERHSAWLRWGYSCKISIHAPLTGSDNDCYAMYVSLSISIHAPLTRSDKWRKRNR